MQPIAERYYTIIYNKFAQFKKMLYLCPAFCAFYTRVAQNDTENKYKKEQIKTLW